MGWKGGSMIGCVCDWDDAATFRQEMEEEEEEEEEALEDKTLQTDTHEYGKWKSHEKES